MLAAADGDEALTVFQARRQDISLVHARRGHAQAQRLRRLRRIKDDWPEARVIFCSGYDPETAQFAIRRRRTFAIGGETLRSRDTVAAGRGREVLDAEELCPTH